MAKVEALIERNDNNFYAITIKKPFKGCYFGGYGYSVAEAKSDFIESINEQLEMAEQKGISIPKIEEIEIEYKYDIPSFFNAFDWIKISTLAKKAGINESKMRAYKTGASKASEKTAQKIFDTIHVLGAELSSVNV